MENACSCCPSPNARSVSNTPLFDEWRSSKAFTTFVVVFAVFTDLLLYGLIVPVTPTALRERVGLPEGDEQAWTSILLALYGAALLAISPIAGYIADRIESRRWPLMAGLIALGGATVLLCVGTNLSLWIVGRLFQGASAAVVWTAGCALLVDTVGKEELGQSMGYIGMGATLGTMGGPLLGGVIYENGGYYAVFGLAFGLVGIDIVFRTVMVEKKHPTERLTLTNIFPVQKPTADETTAQGTAATPIAVLHDTHSDVQDGTANSLLYTTPERNLSVHVLSVRDAEENNPLPSTSPQRKSAALTLLSSARMIVVIWVYFVVSVALSSFDSVLPLFVESTFGWTRTGQGLIFLPLSIPFVLDPVVGRINDKYRDARRYLAAGALLSTVPVGVCLRFVFHNSIQDKVLLCILLALLGLCFTFLLPSILVEVSYIVREKEEETPDAFGRGGAMALAYGILNAAFAAGTTVGPFFAGFIRESSGWDTMSWALIILTGASALPVLLCLGGIAWKKRRAES